MATDFFDRQDHARRQTGRLLIMFTAAVVTIILAIYFALALTLNFTEGIRSAQHLAEAPASHTLREEQLLAHNPNLWQPGLFYGVALGTTLVILVGSLYKISELSAGGDAIAAMLGGRRVNPQTQEPAERRLLNVVEEMALASGVPVPPVYVLDREEGINAFAAGHQPSDAVVAVSAGCLKYLDREELQGVVGHEFSHILNGDMRLNLRLIGVVHGILILAIIGYYCVRMSGSGSSRKSSGGVAMFGLVLIVFGYLGVFFGKLIKSAISRQREFLADASAVQFTRNPGGLAGALKKIGGLTVGSRIRDAHAAEVSHMFFSNALTGSLFNFFATHPPLVERVRRLEPAFDGRFSRVVPIVPTVAVDVGPPSRSARGGRIPLPLPLPVGLPVAGATMGLDAGRVTERVGAPQPEQLEQVEQIVADIPGPLLEAAREPFLAQGVIYALLLDRSDEVTHVAQLRVLQEQTAAALYVRMRRFEEMTKPLPDMARLPLADLTVPALKCLSAEQYGEFRAVVEQLVQADQKMNLFEYCLRCVLFSYLDVHFGRKKPAAVRRRRATTLAAPARLVLSTLAYAGNAEQQAIERAFAAGARLLGVQWSLSPREECSLHAFDAALSDLAGAPPQSKRQLVTAVAACIMADDKVTVRESELLRAVAAVLACPLPPLSAAAKK